MVNALSSLLQLESMPTTGDSPLVKRETTKFDDWPLKLGPHLIGAKTRKVQVSFVCIIDVLFLAFKILKAIKENSSIFTKRTTILFLETL